MSDLQDALKPEYVSMMENWAVSQSEYRKIHAVIKAARKYANLDKAIDPKQLNSGLKFAHITDSDAEYLVYVAQQVQAALGVTEDTDGD